MKPLSNKHKNLLSILGLILIIALFVIFSQLAQFYNKELISLMGDNIYGRIIYSLLLIIESIVAPLSFLPLVALASNLWGPFITGIITWISWVIGAVLIFFIGRKFRICLISKIIPLDKIAEAESYISENNYFWSIVLLRMIIPADLLSYALSLFSTIKFKTYFWTTLIGIAPFAFILTYLGVLPLIYQLIGILIIFLITFVGYKKSKNNKQRLKRLKKIRKELAKRYDKECKV